MKRNYVFSVVLSSLISGLASGQFLFESGVLESPSDQDFGFGQAIAVSDGSIFVATYSPFLNGLSSTVYHFNHDGLLLGEFLPQEPENVGLFGCDLAVDGNLLAVGARASRPAVDQPAFGAVFVYDLTTGEEVWAFYPDADDGVSGFGGYIDISDGKLIVGTSGHDSNQVYIYDVITGEQLSHVTINDSVPRGENVAIADGYAVVGSEVQGRPQGWASVYDSVSGELLYDLEPEKRYQRDGFGSSLAVGGGLIAAGSPGVDDSAERGVVSIFDAETGKLLRTLSASDGREGDMFGASVVIEGDVLLVGSLYGDAAGVPSGTAYIFDLTSGDQKIKLGTDNDYLMGAFGYALDYYNGLAVIGYYNDNFATDAYYYQVGLDYCPADLDRNGLLTPADFSAWVALFVQRSPECDQNADGDCTPADFSAWVANFNIGC